MSKPASLNKSAFERGAYVGYNSRGYACRIRKHGRGRNMNWFIARHPNDTAGVSKYARTLREAAEQVRYV
jgi:hypothetical protein